MAQGSNEYSQLEEGRSKLLLSAVPPGLGAAAEVQKRLTLWEERRFEELLRRADEHLLFSRRPRQEKVARRPWPRLRAKELLPTSLCGRAGPIANLAAGSSTRSAR